jgi:transposase
MAATTVSLRALTKAQRGELERLSRSRTAPARLVERARIVLAFAEGRRPSGIAESLGVSRPTVSTWVRRFDELGLDGLQDRPRCGRPHTDSVEERAEVVAAALSDPRRLGLPFACWTLDRLTAYLGEQRGIAIKRSRIDEILLAEGLRWRKQETWFGEKVDPKFAEKRGSSNGSTPGRRKAARSSASTRWDPSRPRVSRAGNSSGPTAGRRSGRPRRSTTAGAARGTSWVPSGPRPAKR